MVWLKTQCRIHFQNRFVVVALDTVKLELLAFHLGAFPKTAESKLAVQHWLGLAVRNRFGHIAAADDPVEEWAKRCLHDALALDPNVIRLP